MTRKKKFRLNLLIESSNIKTFDPNRTRSNITELAYWIVKVITQWVISSSTSDRTEIKFMFKMIISTQCQPQLNHNVMLTQSQLEINQWLPWHWFISSESTIIHTGTNKTRMMEHNNIMFKYRITTNVTNLNQTC